MKPEHSRRSFLRAVGAGAAALPFFRLLENSAVHAQGEASLTRLVTVFHMHGAASPLFARRSGETETDFDISYPGCVLSCFDDPATYGVSFKDKLLAIDGIDLAAGIMGGKAGHDAVGGIFTGSAPSDMPPNSSIEQYLAVEQGLGADTRFSSLVLGIGYNGSNQQENISYGAGGVLLPKVIDPSETFNTVFADLAVGEDAAAQADAERRSALGKSILDYVRNDIGRIYPRLAAAEQAKLDLHLTTLRELEKRLEGLQSACALPDNPGQFPQTGTWTGGGPYMHEITQLQLGFLAQAFACDLTRFASVFLHDLSRGAEAGTGIALNAGEDDNHGAIAHQYSPPVFDGTQQVEAGNPASWERLGLINSYNYSSVAAFMKQLHDGDLLDDTLIYMSTDMGHPNLHSSIDVPMVLLGGAGGKFQMGRHIALKPTCFENKRWCGEGELQYVPQNRVLVSIAQAFGVDTDRFGTAGDPSLIQGELSELTQLGVSL